MNLSKLACYQITGVGAVSIIGVLLFFLPILGIIDKPLIDSQSHEVNALSGPLEIDHLYSFDEMAGDAQLPFSFLRVQDSFIDTERDCEFCIRVEYVPGPGGVAGIAFRNDQGLDLSTAKKVTFYAMGLDGGEVVKFKAAGKKVDKKDVSDMEIFNNVKFDRTTEEVTLTKNWKKLEIDISKDDLNGITHPFGLEISKEKNKPDSVVYLKGVKYEFEPATNPLQ